MANGFITAVDFPFKFDVIKVMEKIEWMLYYLWQPWKHLRSISDKLSPDCKIQAIGRSVSASTERFCF